MPTLSSIIVDSLVVLHLVFIVFVLLGGLLVLWRRWVLYLHVPAALWGILIEFLDWRCPLTPLEQYFRQFNELPYQGTFVDHYILPIVYPAGLTHDLQIFFGVSVLAVNILIYGCLVVKYLRRKESNQSSGNHS